LNNVIIIQAYVMSRAKSAICKNSLQTAWNCV
jgi:hypothetical protein